MEEGGSIGSRKICRNGYTIKVILVGESVVQGGLGVLLPGRVVLVEDGVVLEKGQEVLEVENL